MAEYHLKNGWPTKPKLMQKPVLFLLVLFALCRPGKAQDAVADSTFSKAAYDNAVNTWYKNTDKQSRLYNGWLHIGYSHKIEGNAYYPGREWQKGTVIYDGLSFPDVLMMYDVYKDELIVQHFHKLMLNLHNEKVKEFSFGNSRFIRIERDSAKRMTLSTGFYQEMHKGKISFLVKRQKIMEETITDVLEQKFLSKNYYYVNRNETWHAVKTYKDLLAVFKDHQKEVRQHLKKNKVRYRKDKENAILLAVQHIDAITQ